MQIVTNDFKTELREGNHWLLFAPIPVIASASRHEWPILADARAETGHVEIYYKMIIGRARKIGHTAKFVISSASSGHTGGLNPDFGKFPQISAIPFKETIFA